MIEELFRLVDGYIPTDMDIWTMLVYPNLLRGPSRVYRLTGHNRTSRKTHYKYAKSVQGNEYIFEFAQMPLCGPDLHLVS